MFHKSKDKWKPHALCDNCGKRVTDGIVKERFPFTADLCSCLLSTPSLGVQPLQNGRRSVCPVESSVEVSADELSRINIPDRYEVVEKLGEGGMGAVYSVREKFQNKLTAIKVMKPEFIKDRAAVKRFEKEAAAVSDLTHPNIAQVFGCSRSEGSAPYLMMEYVDGSSLAQVLKHERTIEQNRAVDMFLQVCEGLEHAHMKGVVHRDLSPGNIIIRETLDGTDGVKIVDFGIAKLAPVQGVTELTQHGDVLGSPKYMSPEQARGDIIDHRSDIYSLGCVMYESLTGKPLFVGANGIQILMHHLNTPITTGMARLRASRVKSSLSAVIAKMLAKDVKHRYQTVSEVIAELQKIKAGRVPAIVLRRRMLIAAATAATAAVVTLGYVAVGLVTCSQYAQSSPFSLQSQGAVPIVVELPEFTLSWTRARAH